MSAFGKAADFIRSVFSRDQREKEIAAAGVDTGDFPVDLFGNVAVQAMSHGISQDQFQLNNALMARFVDYESMKTYGDIATALNIFCDDSTVLDAQKGHVLWTECKDEQIRQSLDEMFHKRLRVDDESWETIYGLVSYGNDFEEICVTENGVQDLNFLPTPTVRRIEQSNGVLSGFVQSFKGNFQVQPETLKNIQFSKGVGKDARSGVVLFEPWRVVHMRLRSTRRRAMYGVSLLESSRWVWRRLILLEDAALISRLSRAPSRFAFYVDVGKLPSEKAEKYLDEIRRKMKKRPFINPRNGKLDLRFNPISSQEDFYLPVRESREIVRADVLNTPQWTGVEDIEYFRNKLHAALMVPRAYLGYDENMPSRATLSAEDARFGKSVLRIQSAYRAGMRQVANVDLAARGIDPKYVDFDIKMTVPSAIFEMAQLEVQNMRVQFASQMGELVSKHWILSKVFGFSDAEIEKVFQQKDEEMKSAMKLQGGEMGGRFESSTPKPGADPRVRNQRILTTSKSKLYPLEQKLLEGRNHQSEKRLEDKIDRVLTDNRAMSNRMLQTHSFMNELRGTLRSQPGTQT
jgi:hypothetical protein